MFASQVKVFDLKNYEEKEEFFHYFANSIVYCEIINQLTGEKNVAKIINSPINKLPRLEVTNLYREVYINSMIKHPCFLKYIGFSAQNFKLEPKPVIVFEHVPKVTLISLLKSRKSIFISFHKYELMISDKREDEPEETKMKLTPTKKLIILYCVASGMSYLHSNNIIHRNLNPFCIFFDDNFLPKISALDISKELEQIFPLDEPRKDGEFIGNERYFSPEILSNFEYGKPSDVYSFSYLIYEIMMDKMPESYDNNSRPQLDHSIPECYENLIVKCWSENPNERPTFDEIVDELRNNRDFITADINEEEYRNYIKFIDNSEISFGSEQISIEKLDEIVISRNNKNKRINFDAKYRGPIESDPILDITKYKVKCNFVDEKAVDKETNIQFNVDSCSKEINQFLRFEIINFARSVNIMCQINHPAIAKFVGYSPVDFDNRPYPFYLTEDSIKFFVEEKAGDDLEKIAEDENDVVIDYTLKLMICYGIASAMAYLQEHNILHRNLKKGSIQLNHQMLPVLTCLNIAKEMDFDSIEPNETIKGSPTYIAPEVYLNKGYNKKSDVYSYGLILYEIFTGDEPYDKFYNPKSIKNKICYENYRPQFNKVIPKCYQQLIERCWSSDPSSRPTFSEILTELKTNQDFIIDTVDKGRFFEYVSYIDEFPVTFEPNRRINQLDDILNNQLNSYYDCKTSTHFYYMTETEPNNLIIDDDNYLDPDDFNNCCNIKKGYFYAVNLVQHKETNDYYAVKSAVIYFRCIYKHEVINLSRELNILLQLNHPSILKFYGYGLKQDDINLFTEFCRIGSLGRVLQLKRSKIQHNSDLIDMDEEEEKEEEEVKNKLNETKENKEENDEEEEEEEDECDHFNEEENKKEEIDDDDSEEDNDDIKRFEINIELDDTTIFIIIYGIAAGMEYLHSHNILHRDLKPSNIYIDDFKRPKISGFNIAKEMKNDSIKPNETIKGSPTYIAPEVYLNKGYNKKSDVYSYGLILYEIFTGDEPYDKLYSPKSIKNKICYENYRPQFNKVIPKCYQQLIERCWSSDPSSRPTFSDILTELKTNPEFTQNVDQEELSNYFKYFEESPKSFESSRKIKDIDEIIRRKLYKFPEYKSKINLRPNSETESNNVSTEYDYCKISNFKDLTLLKDEELYKLYTFKDKTTETNYIAEKIYIYKDRYDMTNPNSIANEINNILKLQNPFFLRFIKFSPYGFFNKAYPVFIFEGPQNKNLEILNEKLKKDSFISNTEKLIILYGIASAMSYLHSINIIHCKLKPSNIFLDEFLFPKITGFYESRLLSENPIIRLSNLIDLFGFDTINVDIHDSPELIKSFIYSAAGDVFSFAIIAYELITNKDPSDQLKDNEEIINGSRPLIDENVPFYYKNLIEKCWNQDPKERPTFDEIVNYLISNDEFITQNIDKEKFFEFVQLVDEIPKVNNDDKIFELDNFIQTRNQRFRKIKIDYSQFRDKTRIQLYIDLGSSDLSKYIKLKKIGSGSFGNVYTIKDKQEKNIYVAKVSKYDINICKEDIIINLSREIDILSKLNYFSILQFIGYSSKNFKNRYKPVIITEFSPNKTLSNMLKNELKGLTDPNWNDTKKLINIYGIAAGMLYLHNKDIIHRDLKPENILLDEYLYPKIADFGLAKYLNDSKSRKKKFFSGCKGTYIYMSPEALKDYDYSKKNDIYAFAMIIYQIITGEIPFNYYNSYQLMIALLKKVRPKFNKPIPGFYKDLIERCWDDNPLKRPSFSEICYILENNQNFITEGVDKDEFYDYIQHVKDIQENESKTNSFKTNKVLIQSKDKLKIEENYECFINLNKFEKQDMINKRDTIKYCKVIEKGTENIFAAFMSILKVKKLPKEEIEKLSKELKIISELNHPSLLKFIGFSLYDFKNQRKPVVITELPSNQSLEQILELEKRNIKINSWDSTKKLIIIYGIASGIAYMHSHNIIHRNLMPSTIYLDDLLLPKIGDFGLLTRFLNSNAMTLQSISGNVGTSIYTAPEVLESGLYSKSSDAYSFSLIVYQIVMNEKPFYEYDNQYQIYDLIINKGERPSINKNIPKALEKLIRSCWSQNPKERPNFDEITKLLRNDPEFITEEINQEDYQKYIKFIDSHTKNDMNIPVKEETVDKTKKEEEIDKLDFISENPDEIDLSPIKEQENNEHLAIIDNLIESKDTKELMKFLNENCDNETTSLIFDNIYKKSPTFCLDLCKEGISLNNAVSHHKYAIFNELEPNETHEHLIESIKLGFNFSYFSLSRLYHEVYKDDEKAFNAAEEGFKKEEKYSTCLLGYFIAHGIGTNKNFKKGLSLILSSKAVDYQPIFSTDIGIYYSQINNKESEMFKWFEKAFKLNQTKATINNYGVCLMKGIGVDKNIEKAKEIFKIGVKKNDTNSMYHLASILEETDQQESLKYYKKAADEGHSRSQYKYAKLLEEKDPNLSLKYFIKYANEWKNIESQEYLVMKYVKEKDIENILKYIHLLIKEGVFRVPLNYAIMLYKSKLFKQAFYIFSILYQYNHPIAMYFIGLMKYNGEGCMKDIKESHRIMEILSSKGIDRATQFLKDFDF